MTINSPHPNPYFDFTEFFSFLLEKNNAHKEGCFGKFSRHNIVYFVMNVQIIILLIIHSALSCVCRSHYNDDTWGPRRHRSTATRLFVWQLICRPTAKKTSSILITRLVWGESTGGRGFPSQKASNAEKFPFHDLSCFTHKWTKYIMGYVVRMLRVL